MSNRYIHWLVTYSDEQLDNYIKETPFDLIFDDYHNLFAAWNVIRSELYKYTDLESAVSKLGGEVKWDDDNVKIIQDLKEANIEYERTLNKMNELTRKYNKR